MRYPRISWEIGGDRVVVREGGVMPSAPLFLQHASGQIFQDDEDDVYGFSSISDHGEQCTVVFASIVSAWGGGGGGGSSNTPPTHKHTH